MEIIEHAVNSTTSTPPRKRSATMFNDQENNFLPLMPATHSGSQTPLLSQGSAVLSRKSSHRLARKPPIPFLTLTPESAAMPSDFSATSPSGIHPVSPNPLYNSIGSMPSPIDPPAARSAGRSSFRARSNTAMSFKSVDFVLAVEEKLRVDTTIVDYDPDPVFHRAVMSPTGERPVQEAFVEQVGSFDIGFLRKDSLGNLPKINHSPSSDRSCDGQNEDNEDDKTVTASPYRLASPRIETGFSPMSSSEASPVFRSITTPRSALDHHDGAADSAPYTPIDPTEQDEVFEVPPTGLIPFPPPVLSRRLTDQTPPPTVDLHRRVTLPNTANNNRPVVLPTASRPCAELSYAEVHPDHIFEPSTEGKGSSSASIMQEILSRDSTPKGSPDNSRRGSSV